MGPGASRSRPTEPGRAGCAWILANVLKVKAAVSKVLAGENPGSIAKADHKEWYRELFEP